MIRLINYEFLALLFNYNLYVYKHIYTHTSRIVTIIFHFLFKVVLSEIAFNYKKLLHIYLTRFFLKRP